MSSHGKRYPQDSEGRVLPHSDTAETDVLGCVLGNPEAIARTFASLPPDAFYQSKHKTIYGAAYSLYQAGETVDLTTVAAKLEKDGELQRVGGLTYLGLLVSETALSSLTDSHIAIILDAYQNRRLITICRQTASEAHSEPFERSISDHEKRILELHSDSTGRNYGTAADGLAETNEMIRAYQDGSIHKKIVPLGFHQIDVKWKGFPGDYTVICGRPGMGKTALMLNMAERLALNSAHPRPIGIISMEMTREQLVSRMLHGRSGVPMWVAENKKLTEGQLSLIADTNKELANACIYIDDSGTQTPTTIRSRIQQWKLKHGVEAVYVDYLGLISAAGDGLYEQVTAASKAMKQIAKDVGVSMIVAAQLSRKTETRPNKRPQLADLRDSGAIEQDCDLILGVYRAEYYAQMRENVSEEDMNKVRGKAEVICLKARRGENGWTAKLRWDGPLTRFSDDLPEHLR